jgi:hypothetical protein
MAQRLRTKPPIWPVVGIAVFVFFWIAASIWLALALAVCVAILLAAHWAWTRLPGYFSDGPDRRESPPPQKRRRAR